MNDFVLALFHVEHGHRSLYGQAWKCFSNMAGKTMDLSDFPKNSTSRLAQSSITFAPRQDMSQPIIIGPLDSAELNPTPITFSWILDGQPIAHSRNLVKSRDRLSSLVTWECAPGLFDWFYAEDETVYIISGEVFITQNGAERRLGAGDFAFFPGGSTCTWRITETVRKVAFLRKDVPKLVGFSILAWHKLLRMMGLRRTMPL
jgi:uncharacterized cupin superfamily protein